MAYMVQKFGKFMTSNDYYNGWYDGDSRDELYWQPFARGECLFIFEAMSFAEDKLLNNDAVEYYGIVPGPKFNSEQVNYYTTISDGYSIYGVFVDFAKEGSAQETLTMFTAVLECWASETYRKCTPILFELNMQLKYSQTQDETDMCEYCRAGIMFDLGRILESALGNYHFDHEFVIACENGTDWASVWETIWDSASANLDVFLEKLTSGTL